MKLKISNPGRQVCQISTVVNLDNLIPKRRRRERKVEEAMLESLIPSHLMKIPKVRAVEELYLKLKELKNPWTETNLTILLREVGKELLSK